MNIDIEFVRSLVRRSDVKGFLHVYPSYQHPEVFKSALLYGVYQLQASRKHNLPLDNLQKLVKEAQFSQYSVQEQLIGIQQQLRSLQKKVDKYHPPMKHNRTLSVNFVNSLSMSKIVNEEVSEELLRGVQTGQSQYRIPEYPIKEPVLKWMSNLDSS